MATELIDSHAHLDSKEFDSDREEMIERARAAGVTRLVTIGAGQGEWQSAQNAITLAERYPFVWASVGIHPHDAATEYDLERLRGLAEHPKVVAIGETGLDFFRDWSPRDAQEQWFRGQINLARELKKPLIIHSRQAGEECFKILQEERASEVGGVFHCFSEDAEYAKRLTTINFIVSIPGTVTFKKADKLREIVSAIPLSQIMVETDAPYMAPEPHRGKRCESAFMVETAKMIAKLKGISFEECAAELTRTTERFFKLPSI